MLQPDSESIAIEPHGAFDHMPHAERVRELRDRQVLAADRLHGVTGDYLQGWNAREMGNDLFGNANPDMVVIRIAGKVIQRHDGHRIDVDERPAFCGD
jgi:hypothetical protein